MLSEHECYYGLGMNALGSYVLSKHERYYGLSMDALEPCALGLLWFGMDALVTVCSRSTYALERRTLVLFGLVTVRSCTTNVL